MKGKCPKPRLSWGPFTNREGGDGSWLCRQESSMLAADSYCIPGILCGRASQYQAQQNSSAAVAGKTKQNTVGGRCPTFHISRRLTDVSICCFVHDTLCTRIEANPRSGIIILYNSYVYNCSIYCCCNIPVSYTHLTLPTICSV